MKLSYQDFCSAVNDLSVKHTISPPKTEEELRDLYNSYSRIARYIDSPEVSVEPDIRGKPALFFGSKPPIPGQNPLSN